MSLRIRLAQNRLTQNAVLPLAATLLLAMLAAGQETQAQGHKIAAQFLRDYAEATGIMTEDGDE